MSHMMDMSLMDTSPAEEVAQNTPTGLEDIFTIDDTGKGIMQSTNGDAIANNVAGAGSFADSTVYANGDKGSQLIDRGAADVARTSGLADNMQEGTNIPTTGKNADYNNMDWDSTQRLARIADAFNAGHKWTPGKVGIDSASRQLPQFAKNDAVQTQEMRRNDLTHQGLGQQQSLALNRENEILEYPQKLVEMFDKAGLDANTAALEIRRNFADYVQRARYDAEFSNVWNQALQKDILKWTAELSQYEGNRVATILYNAMRTNPTLATWITGEVGKVTNPSESQFLVGEIKKTLYNDPEFWKLTPEQQSQQLKQIEAQIDSYTAYTQSQHSTEYGKYGTMGGVSGWVTGNGPYVK